MRILSLLALVLSICAPLALTVPAGTGTASSDSSSSDSTSASYTFTDLKRKSFTATVAPFKTGCHTNVPFQVKVDDNAYLCLEKDWNIKYSFGNQGDSSTQSEVYWLNNCPAENRTIFREKTDSQKIMGFGCSDCNGVFDCRKIVPSKSDCNGDFNNTHINDSFERWDCGASHYVSPTGAELSWHPASYLNEGKCPDQWNYPVTVPLKKYFGSDTYLCLELTWATDFKFKNDDYQENYVNICPIESITLLKGKQVNEIQAFGCSDCKQTLGCLEVVFQNDTCPQGKTKLANGYDDQVAFTCASSCFEYFISTSKSGCVQSGMKFNLLHSNIVVSYKNNALQLTQPPSSPLVIEYTEPNMFKEETSGKCLSIENGKFVLANCDPTPKLTVVRLSPKTPMFFLSDGKGNFVDNNLNVVQAPDSAVRGVFKLQLKQ